MNKMASYLLTCDCGMAHAIATHQAGQSLACGCGRTLKVPSLLQIKRLSIADGETASAETAAVASAHAAVSRRWLVRFLGGLAMMVTVPIFIGVLLFSDPVPHQVLAKRTAFRFNGAWVPQNSTPIPVMEQWILVLTPDDIDAMPPMTAYFYFDALRDGPALSFNFRENYQTFVDWYHIRVAACGGLMFLALGPFLTSWLMPQREVSVGTRSGSEWRR